MQEQNKNMNALDSKERAEFHRSLRGSSELRHDIYGQYLDDETQEKWLLWKKAVIWATSQPSALPRSGRPSRLVDAQEVELAVLDLGGIHEGEFEDNEVTLLDGATEVLQQQLVTYSRNTKGLTLSLYAKIPTKSTQPAATVSTVDEAAPVTSRDACCGNPSNCPNDYRDCPSGGVLPEQTPDAAFSCAWESKRMMSVPLERRPGHYVVGFVVDNMDGHTSSELIRKIIGRTGAANRTIDSFRNDRQFFLLLNAWEAKVWRNNRTAELEALLAYITGTATSPAL